MSELKKKLEDTIEQYNKLNQQITEGETQLAQMKDGRQQLLGKVQAYQELLQESTDPPTSPNGTVEEELLEEVVANKKDK